jgi:hypothetical protein
MVRKDITAIRIGKQRFSSNDPKEIIMIPSEYTANKLRQLNTYMLAEPKRVNMDYWVAIADPAQYDKLELEEVDINDCDYKAQLALITQRPPCGAIGCQAGNLCIMEGKIKPSEHFNDTEVYCITYSDALKMGAEILQLSEKEASKLFFMKHWGYKMVGWPEKFAKKLEEYEPGTLEYTQVIIDRNEHYIATGE